MDPVAIAKLWELGPVVSLLLGAVWYFHKRDVRNDQRSEARHQACEDRSNKLATRVELLEDKLVTHYQELAGRGYAGLDRCNDYLKRLLNDPVTPPQQFPVIGGSRYPTPKP